MPDSDEKRQKELARAPEPEPSLTACDICGSTAIEEIRCKVVCRNCRTILRTCSDL